MVLWVVFLGLFLMCAGISVVFSVYICLLWYASLGSPPPLGSPAKPTGLSSSELRMLPEGTAGGLAGKECSVCLDDIEAGQLARVLPMCGHAFHRPCADAWLSSHPACPMCRAVLPRMASTPTKPPPMLPPPPPPLLAVHIQVE